jgi:hypothetical protein
VGDVGVGLPPRIPCRETHRERLQDCTFAGPGYRLTERLAPDTARVVIPPVMALPHNAAWLPSISVSPSSSRRWTVAVAHSGHRVTRIGMPVIEFDHHLAPREETDRVRPSLLLRRRRRLRARSAANRPERRERRPARRSGRWHRAAGAGETLPGAAPPHHGVAGIQGGYAVLGSSTRREGRPESPYGAQDQGRQFRRSASLNVSTD